MFKKFFRSVIKFIIRLSIVALGIAFLFFMSDIKLNKEFRI